MSTRLFSFRIQESTLERLDDQARLRGESKSALAQRLIDEGLRMAAFPGIVFRDGPHGRRAAISHGPDVWQIIPVVRNVEGTGERAIEQAAEWLDLSPREIQAAVSYYGAFPDEIDEWIQSNDDAAQRAEAEWRRAQEVLAR